MRTCMHAFKHTTASVKEIKVSQLQVTNCNVCLRSKNRTASVIKHQGFSTTSHNLKCLCLRSGGVPHRLLPCDLLQAQLHRQSRQRLRTSRDSVFLRQHHRPQTYVLNPRSRLQSRSRPRNRQRRHTDGPLGWWGPTGPSPHG